MKTRALFIFLSALFGLSSCESETYMNYELLNNCSDTIFFSGTIIMYDIPMDDWIAPNASTRLTNFSQHGKILQAQSPSFLFGDSLFITNIHGDTLKTDYKDTANWQYTINVSRFTAEHEYTLIVSDDDF